MDKPGTLKVIDGVEHKLSPEGQWEPSTPSEALKKQFMNAGTSLYGKIKGAMSPTTPAAEPAPTGGDTLNNLTGKPF